MIIYEEVDKYNINILWTPEPQDPLKEMFGSFRYYHSLKSWYMEIKNTTDDVTYSLCTLEELYNKLKELNNKEVK